MSVTCPGSLLSRGGRLRGSIATPAPPSFEGRRADQAAAPRRPVGEKRFRYFPDRASVPLSQPRVIGVGCSDILPGEAYPPPNQPKLYTFDWRSGRTLPEHQVLLLSNAAGEFESQATGRVRLLGDVLIFLFPGVWHRFRPLPSGGWNERWVSLHGEPVRRRFAEAGVGASCPLYSPSEPGRLRAAFDLLVDASDACQCVFGSTKSLAFRLVDEAIRQATDLQPAAEVLMASEEPVVEDEIVRQALEIIWNDEHCPSLGVGDVARKLPVTRRTLDRRFSETLGRTVLDEINACRITRAKRLLADTDMPVKAVAYRAGFPSRERLRLAFINHEGMPPSEYREAVRRDRGNGSG